MEERHILKRDGRIESWSTNRIADAIFKAFKANGIKDRLMADRLAKKVEELVFSNGDTMPAQEYIQDCVEDVLMDNKLNVVAKSYIKYREQRRIQREASNVYLLDSKETIEAYMDKSDWRINENANMSHSFSGLILHMQGEMQKKYILNQFPKEIREAHLNGYFHIHDLSFGLTGYCSGWSLRDLLLEGFNNEYAPNACSAGPAKHFDAALGQIVNFLGTLQNEWAGAQAFNNVDTYLAPFIRKDNLTYAQVKQDVQKFVFNMNTTSRWGSQSPFSNITLDLVCPKHMENEAIIIGGKLQDSTFKEYQKEMDMFNKAYVEVLLKGDYKGKIFSFPIPTYNVTPDFPWDGEVGQLILQMTAKYGIPYFQNFINSDISPEDVRSMCPLHPDEKVMVKVDGVVMEKTMLECWLGKDTSSYETYYKGNWYPATVTVTNSIGCKKVTLKNTTFFTMDLRHEQPAKAIIEGPVLNLRCKDLMPDMWLPTSMGTYNGEMFIHRTDPSKIVWDQIEKIEDVPYTGNVYCFVVDNKEHLFTLSNGIITHNCRLQMDLRELRKRTGGLFGAGDLTGSVGVVTLNLSKFAYLAKDEKEFLELITEYAELAKDSLELKRKLIEKNLDDNQMPWTKRYLKNKYNGHFSTIGLIGGHEACMNLLHKGINTEEGVALMQRVLHHLRDITSRFQEETGNLYNLEATPAESVCYRLAKIDKDLYGKSIYISGDENTPYYTNSTNLPVCRTNDVFEALEHQNKLQPLYTGGTVFHSFLGEAVSDTESLKNYILKAMSLTKIPYISITPTFSVCKDHGYISGEHFECPTCNKETEVYSRIVGYYRPVSQWNKGKKQEYSERKVYLFDEENKVEQVESNSLAETSS